MRFALLVLLLAAALVVVALLFRSRRAVVIGAQIAEADARERLHRQQYAHIPSPLPPRKYHAEDGEMTLIDPQVVDLDRELRSICSRANGFSEEERQDFRNGATIDDFYTLLNFARRSSVFALREHNEKWVQVALTAVAMIDAARVDERDLPLTLSLIHHAAERLELRTLQLFDAAAALAEPRTSEIIRSFVRQPLVDKDIQSSWGYQEIQGKERTGFVQRGFDEYEPTLDLLSVALAVRDTIARERYQADVTLATELPAVWFPKAARQGAESILARSVAAASVNGSLHPDAHERADAQSLLIFIVETRSEQDAASLHALAASNAADEVATISLHRDRLFALIVARSFEVGVPSFETRESIKRFEGPLRAALEAAGS